MPTGEENPIGKFDLTLFESKSQAFFLTRFGALKHPLIPKHKIYVEVFGGGAQLLFAKPPSSVEVYNDLDSGLVNFFRVLRDEKSFAEFQRKVSLLPYSREEFDTFKERYKNDAIESQVERAVAFFVLAKQCFGAFFARSWGYSLLSRNNVTYPTLVRRLDTHQQTKGKPNEPGTLRHPYLFGNKMEQMDTLKR